MDIFELLKKSKKISDAERAVVNYVVEHPEKISGISARELARRANVSPMTVTRLCRKLGFSDYADFKIKIAYGLKHAPVKGIDIFESDPLVAVANKMAALDRAGINLTLDLLFMDDLQRAIDVVRGSACVDIFSSRANAVAGRYAFYRFSYAGKNVSIYDDTDLMTCHSFVMPKDHVAIFISRTGLSLALVRCCERLGNASVATLVITGDAKSQLAERADIVLPVFGGVGLARFDLLLFLRSVMFVIDLVVTMSAPEGFASFDKYIQEVTALFRAGGTCEGGSTILPDTLQRDTL